MRDYIDTSYSLPAMQEAPLTPEEEAQMQARLWMLLEKQVRLQTQGDHSSLREETAAELLQSLLFSLRVDLARNGLPMRTLLTADLTDMLKQAQHILQAEVNTAGTLYAIALRSVNTFHSCSLTDTLAGIGQFFKRYDVRLHAHDIPVSIDYPLCRPVPETLQGVLYIRAWLERLLTETRLLACFAPELVEALERRASPDYRELPQNLYEPVAANAVGLALADGTIERLEITYAQAAQIHRQITAQDDAAGRETLTAAAHTACRRLSLTDTASLPYLSYAARTLYPRLALSAQSAAGMFAAC
ncbi:MAG TPA: DUF6179 domain-containing protein [Candidatus Limiplasma sp.]|nr:DUF6179 domain-containing protein [Candidatus Limiplasma sp.]